MDLLAPPTKRGERINNPFNIDKSKNQWEGKITSPDSRFEAFSSPVFGIRAGIKLLRTYFDRYDLKTVSKIFDRYAPPHENNTEEYKKFVADKLGIGIDDEFDLNEAAFPLAVAIITMEQGRCIYPDAMIVEGIELAFQ